MAETTARKVCATTRRKVFAFLVFDICLFLIYFASIDLFQGTVFLQEEEIVQHEGTVNVKLWPFVSQNGSLTDNMSLPISDLDIHQEVPGVGHVWDSSENVSLQVNPRDIAIGLGITTRSRRVVTKVEFYPFFRSFLPSFCKTCSKGYNYNFFMAYDHNDTKLSNKAFVLQWANQFVQITNKQCPKDSNFSIHFVQCTHSKKPAWAQNDAMIEAYFNNMAYYYRINDDTVMETPGWTEGFINQLSVSDPPNVGVVGPKHSGGNTAILTYDFVHITHVDIHGFYYPREFPHWYADRWITVVYEPGRSTKMVNYRINHTMEQGHRYANKPIPVDDIEVPIAAGRVTIARYVNAVKANHRRPSVDKVISMGLWGIQPQYTFGAVRNAQLVPILLPDWILRIYVSKIEGALHVPRKILNKLQLLGAQVVYVNSTTAALPPHRWRYLVATDSSVTHFLIRDADSRLTEREVHVVNDWLVSGKPFHCIRDNVKHVSQAITDGLWGAISKDVEKHLGITWTTLISLPDKAYVVNDTSHKSNSPEKTVDFKNFSLLNSFIWPRIRDHSFCHDSVSCQTWPHSVKFPPRRNSSSFIGQSFGPMGEANVQDIKSLKTISDDKCSVLK